MRIGIVAGESSGDLLGAELIRALKQKQPDISIEGLGGPKMIAEGFNSLFDIERLSVMGFVEPLKRLPDLLKLRRQLHQHFISHPPDIFIGIDAPDFNLGLEAKLKKANIKTAHYVSPSVWAWREYRVKKIAKSVDLMLALFPFEATFYQKHQVPVKYVGHPLADSIALQPDKISARRRLCVDEAATYIAILPGSRKQELQHMAEPFLLAAKALSKKNSHVRFLTTHVNKERFAMFAHQQSKSAPELPIHAFTQRTSDVLEAADIVLVTSGTATLETMLYKKPMVIGYKMSALTNKLAQCLVKTPFAGLPNILAGELVVPELIQANLTPQKLEAAVQFYLDHPAQMKQVERRFLALHQSLRMNSAQKAADAVLELCGHCKV